MHVEIAALCDAATDQGGKLNMLGVFDYIEAELPVVVPRCAAVFRVRYTRSEASEHSLEVSIVDVKDGSDLISPIQSRLPFLPVPEGLDSAAINLILNINRFRLERGGKFSIRFRIDGFLADAVLPLYVRDLTPKEPNPLAN